MDAAADRALARPGQTVAFLKHKIAIETAGGSYLKRVPFGFQAFAQVAKMRDNLVLGEVTELRQFTCRKRRCRKNLAKPFPGRLMGVSW